MAVELIQTWGSDELIAKCARMSYGKFAAENKADDKLIHALRRKGHFTPFTHAGATFRVKAPIFVARQLIRHPVGFTWSERSGRYVTADSETWLPPSNFDELVADHIQGSKNLYEMLCNSGVPREQARAILPQGMMTEWIWSGNVAAWQRLFYWRLDKAAQKETREVVQELRDLLVPHFPISLGDME